MRPRQQFWLVLAALLFVAINQRVYYLGSVGSLGTIAFAVVIPYVGLFRAQALKQRIALVGAGAGLAPAAVLSVTYGFVY